MIFFRALRWHKKSKIDFVYYQFRQKNSNCWPIVSIMYAKVRSHLALQKRCRTIQYAFRTHLRNSPFVKKWGLGAGRGQKGGKTGDIIYR